MANELEIISHPNILFKTFIVNMYHRGAHIHKDFEICCLLSGEAYVRSNEGGFHLECGDIWITSPYQSHEISTSGESCRILSLQVSPQFFRVYPDMDLITLPMDKISQYHRKYFDLLLPLLSVISLTLEKPECYEMHCASLIYMLFCQILSVFPFKKLTEKEKNLYESRGHRMRRITRWIDANYSQKLLLSDIAKQENLSMSYLSHFFCSCYGMSFQRYLSRVRAEHACQMLLSTDLPLLDISVSCGFSDIKYMYRAFRDYYGMMPREYRLRTLKKISENNENSKLQLQQFLTQEQTRKVLARVFSEIRSRICSDSVTVFPYGKLYYYTGDSGGTSSL